MFPTMGKGVYFRWSTTSFEAKNWEPVEKSKKQRIVETALSGIAVQRTDNPQDVAGSQHQEFVEAWDRSVSIY